MEYSVELIKSIWKTRIKELKQELKWVELELNKLELMDPEKDIKFVDYKDSIFLKKVENEN